jgi:acetoin utilization deacetylase AcuC-like enzyme
MATALISHPECHLHEMGPGHPECPRRLDVITDQLQSLRLLDFLVRHDAPAVDREQLLRVHTLHYLNWLESMVPESGLADIDLDTKMNKKTLSAASFAAGALVLATDLVLARRMDNAFCNIRPPGHHASADRAMGFCFFNNVAVGAAHALEEHRLQRIAILDFDVHHGNGTDVIFRDDERVLVCSLFQRDLYPFTGGGGHNAGGIDVALLPGAGGEAMRDAVRATWLPALDDFKPEMIFVSAGFDAHADDSISDLMFSDGDYLWLAGFTMTVAAKHAGGRLVSTLEGGYELDSLARCAATHIRTLAGL